MGPLEIVLNYVCPPKSVEEWPSAKELKLDTDQLQPALSNTDRRFARTIAKIKLESFESRVCRAVKTSDQLKGSVGRLEKRSKVNILTHEKLR